MTQMGRMEEWGGREGVYVYTWLIHDGVQHKLS